jgi:hypothetical protein
LPHAIREQLNRRLHDGEEGKKLVAWLNSLPGSREALAADFAGQAITQQNLSEWKKGGYRDWQLQQDALAMMQTITADADALKKIGSEPLTDKLALWLAARYAVAAQSIRGTDDWQKLREVCADLVELRKGDHSAERLRLDRERWDVEQEQEARKRADMGKIGPLLSLMHRKGLLSLLGIAPLDSPVGLASRTDQELADLIAAKVGNSDDAESDSIQPDQTTRPSMR